jgi:hypothetical protein
MFCAPPCLVGESFPCQCCVLILGEISEKNEIEKTRNNYINVVEMQKN